MNLLNVRLVQRVAFAALLSVPLGASAYSDTDFAHTGYPGTRCKYYGPQGADGYFQMSGQQANGIKNVSTTQYAVCPIVRESLLAFSLFMAEVVVSGDTTCSLYVRNKEGGSAFIFQPSTVQSTGAAGVTRQLFEQPSVPGSDETYALYCKVPINSGILGYASHEWK